MRDFLKFGKFWFISLAFALQFFSMGGVLLHLIPHASILGFEAVWDFFGFPLKQTVFAYSLAAFGGVVGKIFFGYLIDRMQANRPVMFMMLMQAMGIFGLTMVETFDLFLISCYQNYFVTYKFILTMPIFPAARSSTPTFPASLNLKSEKVLIFDG